MTIVSADDKAVVEDTLEEVELAGVVGVGVRVLEGVVARHGEGAVVDDEVVVGLW